MVAQKFTDEELLEALERGQTLADFAKEKDVNIRNVTVRKAKLKKQQLLSDLQSEGHQITGNSLYLDEFGEIKRQWVKTAALPLQQQVEAFRDIFMDYTKDFPRILPTPAPKGVNEDLLTWYPLGDPHIGMLAWGEETGADNWDLNIAESVLCTCFEMAVKSAPKSGKCVINNLGDFLHYDNQDGVTARSKNILDRDGRYTKMCRSALRIMRHMIATALMHHKEVEVINNLGNHDEIGAQWLTIALDAIYENDPRITIQKSPSLFHYVRFGNNLIGSHHGHTCKMDKLPLVMAKARRADWGETNYHYWLTGHIHHDSKKEPTGCVVESFRTLAAPDAYAAGGGWLSGRDQKAIVYDHQFGEVLRTTTPFEKYDTLGRI